MNPCVSIVTLGVMNLVKSRAFYEKLGFRASSASNEHVVFFKSAGTVLALYGRDALAEDATVNSSGGGFRGITLAHNVRKKEDVAATLKEAESAGAQIVKPAQDVFWGGHSGYFSDPDGHLWEVAWNPLFPMNERGEILPP